MSPQEIYSIAGVVALALGGVGWAFRLEGRVNTEKELTAAGFVALQKFLDLKFEGLSREFAAKIDGLDTRLERMERNGNGGPHAR